MNRRKAIGKALASTKKVKKEETEVDEYIETVAKVKEIMFKHGDKPRHGKEYYAGKIAQQFNLDR